MIQRVLHSMRTKLEKAQDEISIQLHQYQHLLIQEPSNERNAEDGSQDKYSDTTAL